MELFQKAFRASDRYMKECNWKDLALLKFCLFAVGIIVGLNICKDKKEGVQIFAGIVFILTYVPLMAKFVPILIEELTS